MNTTTPSLLPHVSRARATCFAFITLFSSALACGSDGADSQNLEQGASNPFLDDQINVGKADTAYQNPDGIEVEVDIEGDVEASSSRIDQAPGMLAQFAQTYLRNRRAFYLQSSAEAASTPEWLVDGEWITQEEAELVEAAKLSHFRLRGVSAVLLHELSSTAQVGDTFTATVPVRPLDIYQEAGDACADVNGHISLDQGVYWYLWNPSKSTCEAEVQELTVTVSKLAPTAETTYPEYDQLIEDGKVTAVMLFGQVESGALEETDPGMVHFNTMAGWLQEAGFQLSEAPVGKRFSKAIDGVDFEIDLYSPDDFAGLSDYYNLLNFDIAVTEHEIVIYQGHSLLGSSAIWQNQRYPDSYQIFFQGGCLGYEYYVTPLLDAKGGWDKLDVVSSVIPVPAEAESGAAFIAKFAWSLDHGYAAAWRDLLGAVRTRVETSAFGVSGVRGNCFTPSGSRCGNGGPTTSSRFEVDSAQDIPDGDENGLASTVEVSSTIVAQSVSVELDVSHESISDLTFSLEHDGAEVVVWDMESEGDTIQQGFTLDEFEGVDAEGIWTLRVVDHYPLYTGRVNRWSLILEH